MWESRNQGRWGGSQIWGYKLKLDHSRPLNPEFGTTKNRGWGEAQIVDITNVGITQNWDILSYDTPESVGSQTLGGNKRVEPSFFPFLHCLFFPFFPLFPPFFPSFYPIFLLLLSLLFSCFTSIFACFFPVFSPFFSFPSPFLPSGRPQQPQSRGAAEAAGLFRQNQTPAGQPAGTATGGARRR